MAYTVTITAVDRFSGQIDKINTRLQRFRDGVARSAASVSAPFTRLGRSLGEFSRLSGLTTISRGFTAIANTAASAAIAIGRVAAPMVGLTGGATVAGMLALVNSWAQMDVVTGNVARRIGISTTSLSRWQGVARLAGMSADEMGTALTTLQDQIAGAFHGTNTQAMQYFQALGVSVRDASGRMRNAEEVMQDVITARQRLERSGRLSGTALAELDRGLFGTEAMRNLLRRSPEELARFRQEVERSGTIVSATQAEQADRFRQSMTGVQLALDGTSRAIAERLMPVVGPMLDSLTQWINRNRELIATRVTEFVERLADFLGRINWVAIAEGVGAVATAMGSLVAQLDRLLGGDGTGVSAMTAFVALWAGSKVASIIGAMRGMTVAVRGLATAGTALMGSGLLSSFSTMVAALAPYMGPISMLAALALGVSQLHQFRRTPEQQAEQAQRMGQRGGMAAGTAPALGAPTGTQRTTEDAVYDALRARGLSAEEAAGVAANVRRESGYRTNAHNPAGGGTGAHGLFQWRGEL